MAHYPSDSTRGQLRWNTDMGGPRYFKVKLRLRDFFISLVYVAIGMTFVRLAVYFTDQGFPAGALLIMAVASLSFGAAVGTLFRIPGWGALVGLRRRQIHR